MDEMRTDPVQWLRYLFYAGIASAVLTILNAFTPLGGLLSWVGIVLSIAVVYLLFMLSGVNVRYKKAAIFGAVGLAISQLPISFVALVGSICSLIGQYQEYHAHGELVADRDEKLSGKWQGLFWLQFVVTLLLSVLISILVVILTMVTGMDEARTTAILTPMAVGIGLLLQGLYLLYLNRTIRLLEADAMA